MRTPDGKVSKTERRLPGTGCEATSLEVQYKNRKLPTTADLWHE